MKLIGGLNMRRFVSLTLMGLITSILFITACQKNGPAVATIGTDEVITLSELKETYSKVAASQPDSTETLEKWQARLDNLINRRLKLKEAYNLHLEDSASVTKPLAEKRREILVRELYKLEVEEKILTENKIREFYARQKKEFVYRMIFLRYPQGYSESQKDSVFQVADDIVKQIREGASFFKLARDYSWDRKTALNGGLHEPTVWDQWDDQIMAHVFYMKKGKVADPFATPGGVRIVKVEDIREHEMPPYEEVKDKMRKTLYGQIREEVADYGSEYYSKVIKDHEYVFNDTLITKMAKWLAPDYQNLEAFSDSCQHFAETSDTTIILWYKGGTVDILEYLEKIKIHEPKYRYNLITYKGLRRFVSATHTLVILEKIAESKRLDKTDDVKKRIKSNLETLLIDVLLKTQVRQNIEQTDEDLKKYYDNHKDQFRTPAMAMVQQIVFDNESKAREALERAKAGEDFAQLVQTYSIHDVSRRKNGVLDYFTKNKHGQIGQTAFKLKEREISDIIPVRKGRWAIIKILDHKQGSVRPYNKKLKGNVKVRHMRYVYEQSLKEFEEMLEKKYPVTIKQEVMGNAFGE